MSGLSFGIGGRAGAYGGQGSSDGVVFASPITPDMSTASSTPADHPATWIIVGAFAVMVVVYVHWHVY